MSDEKRREPFAKQSAQERFESLIDYAKNNIIDTTAFAVLAISIIWLFINPFSAGIVIGVLFGIYFSNDILPCLRNFGQCVDQEGIARVVILGGALLALFIGLPGFFIGTAVAIAIKELYSRGSKRPGSS